MPVLAHPGPTSPTPPGVRLEVPDGWVAEPAGDALLRTGAPGARGDRVDVVVRHVVAAAGEDPAALVAASAASAAAVPPARGDVEEPFVVGIAGRDWYGRNVSWDEDGVPAVEVHLATALTPGPDAAPHVLAVGRVGGTGVDADYDTLQAVLETLVVDEEAR